MSIILEHPEGTPFCEVRFTSPIPVGGIVTVEDRHWIATKQRWNIRPEYRHAVDIHLTVEPAGSKAWPIKLCPSCTKEAPLVWNAAKKGFSHHCEDCELTWDQDQ